MALSNNGLYLALSEKVNNEFYIHIINTSDYKSTKMFMPDLKRNPALAVSDSGEVYGIDDSKKIFKIKNNGIQPDVLENNNGIRNLKFDSNELLGIASGGL
jgi:hypothetical protein